MEIEVGSDRIWYYMHVCDVSYWIAEKGPDYMDIS